MQNSIQIGSRVERINTSDYCLGRTGVVIELEGEARARVHWTKEPDGTLMRKPLRTWVRLDGLKPAK